MGCVGVLFVCAVKVKLETRSRIKQNSFGRSQVLSSKRQNGSSRASNPEYMSISGTLSSSYEIVLYLWDFPAVLKEVMFVLWWEAIYACRMMMRIGMIQLPDGKIVPGLGSE